LGDCEVSAKFPKKGYTLQITPLQLIALLDFNDAPAEKNLDDVRVHIGMEVDVVKRVLHSLSCGKHKVLSKTGNPKSISTADRFSVNLDFKSKTRKIRIHMPALDDANIQKTVQEDRSFAIDACIVRIMKSRKTLGHVNLMQEVIHQVQNTFKPAPKQIKQRIEGLIEREYLERSDADPKIYNYLA
jgi:cullin 1